MNDSQPSLLSPDDLIEGDIMLFHGADGSSRGIQMIDASRYDHAAIVASPPAGDPRTFMYDIGFSGAKHRAIVDYPNPSNRHLPTEILVLRHRIEGWREPMLERAAGIVTDTSYDMDRLVFLVLAALTRFSPGLAAWANPNEEIENNIAAEFVVGLADIFKRIDLTGPTAQQTMVCSDLITHSLDMFSGALEDPKSSYYGVTIPFEPIDGLAQWAASFDTFAEWLDRGQRTRRAAPASDEDHPGSLLQELRSEYGLTSMNRRDADPLDNPGASETFLRDEVNTMTGRLLNHLGLLSKEELTEMSRGSKEAASWYLLDSLLRRGPMITPRNLEQSGSLYRAGFVDCIALARQPTTRT